MAGRIIPEQQEIQQRQIQQTIEFTVDGVTLALHTPFLPAEYFTESQPGDALQAATWSTWRPATEFIVIAVPFGTRPTSENVLTAQPGMAAEYQRALNKARQENHAVLVTDESGPIADIFGQTVPATVSLVSLPVNTGASDATLVPMLLVEWVVEAGKRIWIVRASHELSMGTIDLRAAAPFIDSLAAVELSSDTLNEPSTISLSVDSPPVVVPGPGTSFEPGPNDLPTPSWWDGDCDAINYRARSQHRSSYRLSAGFRNVPVCGPRPLGDHVPDVLTIFPGGHGEYEWECVELSMRFMHLAYGIRAYPANGCEVVRNYSPRFKGDKLQAIPNDYSYPAPRPGDVLSYGHVIPGHTSVCIASNVDAHGNGYITVMEQNYSPTGVRALQVRNWHVIASPPVTGFLQKPTPVRVQIPDEPLYFKEVGQYVADGFKSLWQKPDYGLFVCGYPLRGETNEDGMTVQYFENIRMEWKPAMQARFGAVGRQYVQHPQSQVPSGAETLDPKARYFEQTGHSVGGVFLTLFDRYGVFVCGYPLTGEIDEAGLTTQYFENVRMERRPGLPARFGAVGRQYCELVGLIS